jgi:hypothetical protein
MIGVFRFKIQGPPWGLFHQRFTRKYFVRALSSFSLVVKPKRTIREKLLEALLYKKFALKMLMKLTHDILMKTIKD